MPIVIVTCSGLKDTHTLYGMADAVVCVEKQHAIARRYMPIIISRFFSSKGYDC